MDIMKEWFNYFATVELGEWDPSNDPPNNTKSRTVFACAPKSHYFIRDFFAKDWYTQMYNCEHTVKTMRNGDFRLQPDTFYDMYKEHMKKRYPSSKPRNSDTFLREMELFGITLSRKRKNFTKTIQHIAVDLKEPVIKQKFLELYPTEEWIGWIIPKNTKNTGD